MIIIWFWWKQSSKEDGGWKVRAGGGIWGKNGGGKMEECYPYLLPPPFLPSQLCWMVTFHPPSSLLLCFHQNQIMIVVRVTCCMCPDRRMYSVFIYAAMLHTEDQNIAEKVLVLLITIIDYFLVVFSL